MGQFYYYLIYKPFGTICQFSKEGDHPTLADIPFDFPKDVYSVGRLDTDSEGLLLLTNDNFLKTNLLNPDSHYAKKYWVQVEGAINQEALNNLEKGVEISIKGKKHFTKPASARKLNSEEYTSLPDRNPPIRYRKDIPTSWIELIITEGKNRQVRRMTAKVGFPTLRLVRYGIENYTINDMDLSEVKQLTSFDLPQKKKVPTRKTRRR